MAVAFDRTHKVLRLEFAGLFTPEDVDSIDVAVVEFLGGAGRDQGPVRLLYDMTEVTALAVPTTRFAERARLPAVGGLERIVVAPRDAGPEFGTTYREEGLRSGTAQPVIVRSRKEAYRLLSMIKPNFEQIE